MKPITVRRTLHYILILLLLSSITCGSGSIAIDEQPPLDEMAELADLVFIGTVSNIEITESRTFYTFEVTKWIKNYESEEVYILKIRGGTNTVSSPSPPSFDNNEEYLVFLNTDGSNYVVYGSWGKIKTESVNEAELNNIIIKYQDTIPRRNYSYYYLIFITIIFGASIYYKRAKSL